MKRIGIYPGTFDPLHPGHIAFALKTIEVCKLDEVIFLPETYPRGKTNVTDVNIRLRQLEDSFKSQPQLSARIVESSPFTVHDTLPELQKAFPNSEMTLLVGSDVFARMNDWPDLPLLLASVTLAVGLRQGHTAKKFADNSVVFIELPETAHLSSRTGKLRLDKSN